MSELSQILALPYIQSSQAQKHITHNEALRLLDVLVQMVVEDRDLSAPPVAPDLGACYIIASGATGDWAGHDAEIAVREDGYWRFIEPKSGWLAIVRDELVPVLFDGTDWQDAIPALSEADFQNLASVGIGTTADAVNRLSVASPASLLSHAGDDHRLVLNKASDVDTASVVFQSNWTGHAEAGLSGGRDFALRVSDDGINFTDALQADALSGQVTIPHGLSVGQSVLSYYEEGVWVPDLQFGGLSTGMGYDWQDGQFTRIGNMVHCQCRILLNAKGTATGNAEIKGLPHTPNPSYYPGDVSFISGGAGLNSVQGRPVPGSAIALYNGGTSGMVALTEANFTDAANLKVSIMYFV
jgi:hypothetical protein